MYKGREAKGLLSGLLAARRLVVGRGFALLLGALLAVGATVGASSVLGQEFGLKRRKLTIGGAFVDALADFQRFGGEVDEVTPDELVKKGPTTYGKQHGRSIFAVGSGKPGEIVGIVTADGGGVKASMTRDGFLQVQPASAGFLTRNTQIFQALYPGKPVPSYTEEVIFEYIDESGAHLILGGAEVDKTTSYLFKKDPATGEIILRLRRDILKEKETGQFLDPDVSSTFPTAVKFCDATRSNCISRSIIKKPGDEIRLDPRTRRVNIHFNKDNLPFYKKYRTAQRLSWDCQHQGRGFFITYREGSLGGYKRPGRNETGTLTCQDGVLRCERTGPGQKCNFDFRDYLGRPAEALLFGLDWLLARKDPHTHYFTLAPDPTARRHIRVGNLRNLEFIREANLQARAPGQEGNGHFAAWAADRLKMALCEGASRACVGTPAFKVLEVAAINNGVVLIDERTGTKLKGVERARLFSLRQPYGWGKRGDFVGALITNKKEAAEVAALTRLNEQLEAPPLLDKDSPDMPSDPVKAMLKGLEEEKKRETLRVQLVEQTHALVIFPTTHIEDMKGIFGIPVTSPPPVPAKILSLSPAEPVAAPRTAPARNRPRRPLPPTMPHY